MLDVYHEGLESGEEGLEGGQGRAGGLAGKASLCLQVVVTQGGPGGAVGSSAVKLNRDDWLGRPRCYYFRHPAAQKMAPPRPLTYTHTRQTTLDAASFHPVFIWGGTLGVRLPRQPTAPGRPVQQHPPPKATPDYTPIHLIHVYFWTERNGESSCLNWKE